MSQFFFKSIICVSSYVSSEMHTLICGEHILNSGNQFRPYRNICTIIYSIISLFTLHRTFSGTQTRLEWCIRCKTIQFPTTLKVRFACLTFENIYFILTPPPSTSYKSDKLSNYKSFCDPHILYFKLFKLFEFCVLCYVSREDVS